MCREEADFQSGVGARALCTFPENNGLVSEARAVSWILAYHHHASPPQIVHPESRWGRRAG